jgi:hypothetical protein
MLKVKSVAVWATAQAEFVPVTARNAYPGALAEFLDVVARLGLHHAKHLVFAHLCIQRVTSKLVWNYPGNARCGSGVDKLVMGVWGRPDAQCDDEDILPLERLNKRILTVVVNFLGGNTRWKSASAIFSSDGREIVFSGLEERLCDVPANPSSGLGCYENREGFLQCFNIPRQ